MKWPDLIQLKISSANSIYQPSLTGKVAFANWKDQSIVFAQLMPLGKKKMREAFKLYYCRLRWKKPFEDSAKINKKSLKLGGFGLVSKFRNRQKVEKTAKSFSKVWKEIEKWVEKSITRRRNLWSEWLLTEWRHPTKLHNSDAYITCLCFKM